MVATDSAAIETSAPEVAAAPTGDPSILGLPSFVVGAVALSLATVGYVPPAAVAPPSRSFSGPPVWDCSSPRCGVPTWARASWRASSASSPGFWFSYAALVLGLQHNWFQIPAEDVTRSVALFLISWAVVMFFLTVGSVRLPVIYTILLGLVVIALVLLIFGTLNGSTGLNKLAGYAVLGLGPWLLPVPQLLLCRPGRRALPTRPAAAAIGLVEAIARSRVRADLPQRPIGEHWEGTSRDDRQDAPAFPPRGTHRTS